MSNRRNDPFFSVKYTLGEEAIDQPFLLDNLVALNTPVDCGPLQIEFIDQNGQPLDSAAFATYSLASEDKVFSVLQQENSSTVGTYKVRYRAWLQDHSNVEVYLQEPFTVEIAEPANESQYILNAAPKWLT